jgi:hypothetical protein
MVPPFVTLLFLGMIGIPAAARAMEPVRVSPDRTGFVMGESGMEFGIRGVNCDRDDSAGGGRLLEDYRETWGTVRNDFAEMKAPGANAVRNHLQFGKFMKARDKQDEAAMARSGAPPADPPER